MKKEKKYDTYQEYVIKEGRLIGEFEEMYQDFDDPWLHNELDEYSTSLSICVNLIKKYKLLSVVELGCGLGQLTNKISKVTEKVTGVDISKTAVERASARFPHCNFVVDNFPCFELLRELKPDCIVMSEISWYVLDSLDYFLAFLRKEMPKTLLIHVLQTYDPKVQTYGREKFTNLIEIKNYFGMHYLESGEIQELEESNARKTYFAGTFNKNFSSP